MGRKFNIGDLCVWIKSEDEIEHVKIIDFNTMYTFKAHSYQNEKYNFEAVYYLVENLKNLEDEWVEEDKLKTEDEYEESITPKELDFSQADNDTLERICIIMVASMKMNHVLPDYMLDEIYTKEFIEKVNSYIKTNKNQG